MAKDKPTAGKVEIVDAEQLAAVQQALAAQQQEAALQHEATTIQVRALQAQIIHMLATSLRVLANAKFLTTEDRERLTTKVVYALDMHLGELPDKKSGSCDDCKASTDEAKPKKRRGMGFGAK